MSEYSPPTRKIIMTKSQVRKYIKDLEDKRRIAQEKLDKAKKSGERAKEQQNIKDLENLIDDL